MISRIDEEMISDKRIFVAQLCHLRSRVNEVVATYNMLSLACRQGALPPKASFERHYDRMYRRRRMRMFCRNREGRLVWSSGISTWTGHDMALLARFALPFRVFIPQRFTLKTS